MTGTTDMHRFFYPPVLAACLLAGCATNPAPHVTPPDFTSCRDYRTPNHCLPLSCEAVRLLRDRGIPARQVFFHWDTLNGARGAHAAVLFEYSGSFWYFDNECRTARHVPDSLKTDYQVVLWATPGNSLVHLCDEWHVRRQPMLLKNFLGQ